MDHLPVVVGPGVTLSDQLTGLERLHELDHVQVGHRLNVGVLGGIVVLLGPQDALLEEVLVDGHAVLLGDKHICWWRRLGEVGVGVLARRINSTRLLI